jgi:AraC family transcriptional regulator
MIPPTGPTVAHDRTNWEQDEPRPRIGLRVDLLTALPGVVELDPLPDHRLIIHAGAPVRGACRFHRLLYTRGDVDIFPAGQSDLWEAEGAITSVMLQLSPSLLRRAAEDMGLDPDRAGLELRHQVRGPQIEHIAWALDAERRAGYPSGLLYTDSLGIALAVHLLGRYTAPLTLRAPEPHGAVDAARPQGDADGRGAQLARAVSVGKVP